MTHPKMKKKTWHEEHTDNLSASDRIAISITNFSGSMAFIYIHIVWWSFWFALNGLVLKLDFDKFPYGLLTMILSLEAILLGTFVLIGQNLATKRDKLQAEHDRHTVELILEEVQTGHRLTEQVKKINQNQNRILAELKKGRK